MRIHVQRDRTITQGRATWVEMAHEMVFLVAADGVTPFGAASLQECWRVFVDAGVWQYPAPPGTLLMDSKYFRTDHLGDMAAMVTCRGGRVRGFLNEDHFSPASALGIAKACRDSLATGWWYYAPAARVELAA